MEREKLDKFLCRNCLVLIPQDPDNQCVGGYYIGRLEKDDKYWLFVKTKAGKEQSIYVDPDSIRNILPIQA